MDERQQARVLGMALARGLISLAAIKEAACAGEQNLLETLITCGLLDETDVEVLLGIPDCPCRESVRAPVEPEVSADCQTLWQAVEADGMDGKAVRESFTLPCWKDYRDLRFLAEGGLGRIFAAFDPSLKRTVALKFLRRDDPALVRRFVLEAQHQAKVEHPNICKVFEVGEWKGQAYIAMQFLAGETLETAAPRLSLAEKVEILEIVAEALHAAHRQGLIHRDVKPANILLEALAGEPPKPYILDFGLAKGMETPGLTQQGTVIGTVHYMAPEQAMGQLDRIGRRTDVYGLGATLFKVITGRLVFQGTDSLDGVRRTVEEDPESLRAWVPDAPRDLETIVMKCLEKDPERRYESALALAEDLRRFREGEPILARPVTWAYRTGKYVRKRKGLVAAAGVALALILVMGGWVLTTNLRARRISGFATRFGIEAEGMAASLRMAALLPQHEIRPHKAKVRQRMAELRRVIQEEGPLAEGPGAFALGQGHLALREFPEARRELEKAWAKGYRHPLVALALGQALGALYREGWEEQSRHGDPGQWEQRKQALEKEFRDPALAYLRVGAREMPERQAYVEGQLAYYEERYPLAIAKAQEAFRRDATLYEAKILEGDAQVALGMMRIDPAPGACMALLEEAGRAYAEALGMARSDPALLHAEGFRRYTLAKYAYFYAAAPWGGHDAIQALLNQALAVDPDEAKVYVTKVQLATVYACYLGDHGRDPFPMLDQAIAWCEKATRQTEGRLFISGAQGNVYKWKAAYQLERGQDPRRSLEQASACFQEAISLRPGDVWIQAALADLCTKQGDLAIARGEDPRAILQRGLFLAKKSFQQAASGETAMGVANLYTCLADWQSEHGQEPGHAYGQALDYYRQGMRIAPEDGDLQTGFTDAAVRYAMHLRASGASVEELLREAVTAANRSVQLGPTYLRLFNQGDCFRFQAQVLVDRHQAPSRSLQEAERALRRAEQVNGGADYMLSWVKGQTAMLAGEAALQDRSNPEAHWSRAAAFLAKATRISAQEPKPWLDRVRLAWLQGKWLQAQRRSYSPLVSEGLTLAAHGFALKARQPELLALRGCLYRLQAEATAAPATRRNLLQLAQADLETALGQNRFLVRDFQPELLEVRKRLAEEEDPTAGTS